LAVLLARAAALGKPIPRAAGQSAQQTFADLPAPAQAAISAAIGRDQAEYHAALLDDGSFEIANPAQNLHANFSTDAATVRAGKVEWNLRLSAWGYGDAFQPVENIAPTATANRVEYLRGALTEWYVNGPLGLEQGFTLAQPPAEANGEPLTLALALSSDLRAKVNVERDGLTLTRADGVGVLVYRGLHAYDTAGRVLPAWLEVRDWRMEVGRWRLKVGDWMRLQPPTLRLRSGQAANLYVHVDDRGASYPITIDPYVQRAKLTAADGAAYDYFARSVAISSDGNTIVVGAYGDDIGANSSQGAAYVFVKPSGGWTTMTETAKLTASDGVADDEFGYSVAISGDDTTIVVGARYDNIDSRADQGSAYVFVKPGGGWVGNLNETARLTAADGAAYDYFGTSVAINSDGTTIVVGARGDDNNKGSAYVFVKPGGGWGTGAPTGAKFTASDGGISDWFGISVATSGDGNTIVVGASWDDNGANFQQGSAYVYVKPGGGWANMTETAQLIASDGAAHDQFGYSVAISGDGNTIVVGAPTDDIGANNQGSAYVYMKPGGGWGAGTPTEAKLTASDGAADDDFGVSVAISGDGTTVVVGAYWNNIGVIADQGSVYVFVKPGGGWVNMTETAQLIASDGAMNDDFGISVAIGGDGKTIVVGAWWDDIGVNTNQGSAYIFTGGRDLYLPLILR